MFLTLYCPYDNTYTVIKRKNKYKNLKVNDKVKIKCGDFYEFIVIFTAGSKST